MRENKSRSYPLSFLFLLAAILAAAALLFFAGREFYCAAYPVRYEEIIRRESGNNGLDPAFVYAVIRTESGFNPTAESGAGARGLMQITPVTFEWVRGKLGEEEETTFGDLYDSEENIRYGTALLGLHLAEFGSERSALCAYHAGRSQALAWLRDPEISPDGETIVTIPSGTTSHYVDKVLAAKETYTRLYEYRRTCIQEG